MTDYERLKREFNLSLLGQALQGEQGPPGPRGEKGDTGEKGEKGDPGEGLDTLCIGGRNLLRLTNRGAVRWTVNAQTGTAAVAAFTDTDGTRGMRMQVTEENSGWMFLSYSLADTLPALEPEREYRLSFDIRSDMAHSYNVVLMRGNATGNLTNSRWLKTVGDEQWTHVSVILNTNDLSARDTDYPQVLYIGNLNGSVGYLDIKNLKLERGNVETAWTPAPEDAQADLEAMCERLWPVGSIYMSLDATDPAVRFGGVWARIENAFLLAASDTHPAGESGGEEAHALTESEMPAHTHAQADMKWGSDWLGGQGQWSAASSAAATQQYETAATGGGQAHNNMPPYLAVHVWKRVG